jgi:hypothetical protein
VQVPLHSVGDASSGAALLLAQILPDILTRRALPARRLATLGATRHLHHGLLACQRVFRRLLVMASLTSRGPVPHSRSLHGVAKMRDKGRVNPLHEVHRDATRVYPIEQA